MTTTGASLIPSNGRYRWFAIGDINGFFGLIVDNIAVMAFLAFILTVIFGFPSDIVYKKMFPGTALGVLFGDIVYTWMAFRLAKQTGNTTVTAMPLGLDTPSTIGIGFTVLGPAFLAFKGSGLDAEAAGMQAWYVGMATMILIGVIKVGFSFLGGWVQKVVPQAGLLGSLAGIGLALIGLLPMLEIFSVPVVGLVAMGLLFYSVVAGIRLPKHFPGVLLSIIAGTAIYYIAAPRGWLGIHFEPPPSPHLYFAPPMPTLGFLKGLADGGALPDAWTYLPIAFPFAILTVIGGINVTESARVAGDDYNTRSILLTEAIATLVAGITGGVAQSTPYIGQPAYKAMGSRAGYTLLTGIFIGIAGMTGMIGYIVEAIPRAALTPVLVFVALDIVSQSFLACPKRHAAAVGFAFLPSVARMLTIQYQKVMAPDALAGLMTKADKVLPETQVVVALGNGFILTGMLWGAFLSKMIDRKLKTASVFLFVCAVFSYFGIIHSASIDGNMYKPWLLAKGSPPYNVAHQFAAAYLIFGLLTFALSFTKGSREPIPEHLHA